MIFVLNSNLEKLELDNKLRDIFTDEKEHEFIKSELKKSPVCVPDEFMDLFYNC